MKRRTIVAGLLMIGLVVMMLGVGSWAVFNDTESAGHYTASAGTIDLDLNVPVGLPTHIGDLKPSEWHYLGPFWLHNNGTNPGRLDLHFMNVQDGPGTQTEPECAATWGYLEGGECLGDYYVPADDISNWIDVDYWISTDYVELNTDVVCPTEPGDILGKLGDIQSRAWDLGLEMTPSRWYAVCLSFHLEKDAGNEYQGDETAFDIEFTLHQVGQPADRETIRLENKEDGTVIPGDNIYGSVTYEVNDDGDLEMQIRAHGLQAGAVYQFTLNSQADDTCMSATADQLASGKELHTGYDSGFWTGSIPLANACTPDHNEGIYNFLYASDPSGNITTTATIHNAGVSDPPGGTDVAGAYPTLPRGVYTNVKFIVKEVTNYPPGDSWTPVLMEMETLDFNLP